MRGGLAARAVFAFSDLSGLDLSGCNLADADFTGAILGETNFSGTRLDAASFFGSDLRRVNMNNASIRRGDLREGTIAEKDRYGNLRVLQHDVGPSELPAALLHSANLERAKLSGAVAVQADFTDAVAADSCAPICATRA